MTSQSKIMDKIAFFLIGALCMQLFILFIDKPMNPIYYPSSGIIVTQKQNGERFGKWYYTIKDAYNGPIQGSNRIRTDQDWQVGDTILLIKK